jgi:hypothetical protein
MMTAVSEQLNVPVTSVIQSRAITLMTEAASYSETPVDFYQTTRHYIPKDIFILVAPRT